MTAIAGYVAPDGDDGSKHAVEAMLARLKHRAAPDPRVDFYAKPPIHMGRIYSKRSKDRDPTLILSLKQRMLDGAIYSLPVVTPGPWSGRTRPDHVVLAQLAHAIEKERYSVSVDAAFAYAYSEKNHLIIARDPLGARPLFYTAEPFAFATEPSALRTLGLSDDAILAVEPGSMLLFDPGRDELLKSRYFRFEPPTIFLTDLAYCGSQLVALVREALAHRLTPRSHCALLFSGGVDSALLAALAREIDQTSVPVPLYTVGVEGSHDLAQAQEVARILGMEEMHRCVVLDGDRVETALPVVAKALDSTDPMTVNLGLAVYFGAKRAFADGYRILISGQGADELFGGYQRYCRVGDAERAVMMYEELCTIAARNLERDNIAAAHGGAELRLPYLAAQVVQFALQVHPSLKVRATDAGGHTLKAVLRAAAIEVIPGALAQTPKKAMQFGSGITKCVTRLAKAAGYHGRGRDRRYIESRIGQ